MIAEARLAHVASVISDASRAAMLWSLMGGESRPASELVALLANVSRQTASNHLKTLIQVGLVKVTSLGRNRFYKLSGPSIAVALESLMAVAQLRSKPTGAAERTAPELVVARTCNDHLAGELAVTILRNLLTQGVLRESGQEFLVTDRGERFFKELRMRAVGRKGGRRRFAYACLDWSQRLPHLGGLLGAELLDWMLYSRLLARGRTPRSIRVTNIGKEKLSQLFGIHFSQNGYLIPQNEARA